MTKMLRSRHLKQKCLMISATIAIGVRNGKLRGHGVFPIASTQAQTINCKFRFIFGGAKTPCASFLWRLVGTCCDSDALDESVYCPKRDETSWLRAALKFYRDVKKWENRAREPDAFDDEQHNDDDLGVTNIA